MPCLRSQRLHKISGLNVAPFSFCSELPVAESDGFACWGRFSWSETLLRFRFSTPTFTPPILSLHKSEVWIGPTGIDGCNVIVPNASVFHCLCSAASRFLQVVACEVSSRLLSQLPHNCHQASPHILFLLHPFSLVQQTEASTHLEAQTEQTLSRLPLPAMAIFVLIDP